MNAEAEHEIELVRPALEAVCQRFGVLKLWVFGSALTPSWDPSKSDLDLLVDYGPPPTDVDLFSQQFAMQVELERLFGRKVDLVERLAIRKALFREKVEGSAREVYAA